MQEMSERIKNKNTHVREQEKYEHIMAEGMKRPFMRK